MKKPVRLEINNSGAWKVLGRFDAADDLSADNVLNAAEQLAQALVEAGSRLTLRVSCTDAPHAVLMHWADPETGWRDARGGGSMTDPTWQAHGMTLRDYFAGQALPSIYDSAMVEASQGSGLFSDPDWRTGLARDAYMMADAMLKAREA